MLILKVVTTRVLSYVNAEIYKLRERERETNVAATILMLRKGVSSEASIMLVRDVATEVMKDLQR